MLKKHLIRKGHKGDVWFIIERKEYFKKNGVLGTVHEKIKAPYYNEAKVVKELGALNE